MVDLYTALKLIDVLDKDWELVYLREPGDQPDYRPAKTLTVKQVKDRYDMRRTKAVKVAPYFCCQEYEGMLITIKG